MNNKKKSNVLHVGTLPFSRMGDITRLIVEKCNHDYWQIPYIKDVEAGNMDYDEIPLPPTGYKFYVLHCFKSHNEYFLYFKTKEKEAKIISLMHSSFPCKPAIKSDKVVTITQAADEHFKRFCGMESQIITGAIDLTEFLKVSPDYKAPPVIGKITHYKKSKEGKYHDEYFNIIENVAGKNNGKTLIISNERHPKYFGELDKSVGISDTKTKAETLKKINIYADAHRVGPGSFIETLCTSTLEAMACGIPVVILGTEQPAMVEVVKNGGYVANDIYDFYNAVYLLAKCPDKRKEMGEKARARAIEFNNLVKMIKSWDEITK